MVVGIDRRPLLARPVARRPEHPAPAPPGDGPAHDALPENILVYRDGVSEGQYQKVLDEEMPLLRAACKDAYPALDQARRTGCQEAGADRSGNTKPGTVVDRGITEARSWDFFLQAHTTLQGTAGPAHFFVVSRRGFSAALARENHNNTHIFDLLTTSKSPSVVDELQYLTQSMCYVFGRATKAVSICTPAYYADILYERARCYLSSVFETPSNSAVPSVVGSVEGSIGGLGGGPSQQDVQIHENLKDSMFYI
ncbi:ribonuclease H-like domain-containing protein [Ilyonectria destructans]|nr:ribonuclease H-like domain-containing protein [Ilyonectria destructans]